MHAHVLPYILYHAPHNMLGPEIALLSTHKTVIHDRYS